ncbi:MAG: type II toxin-antitoxin system VapC family toxin [Armatimonadetes bacterium]|nr:type II toxin-antitoxin system VapC family toxin [Armatimonadota bacterium]
MIVLDTHIFLWYALDNPQLQATLREKLRAEPGAVFVPTVCIWESILLAERGSIAISGQSVGKTIRGLIAEAGFNEAPLTGDIAVLSRSLDFKHSDPADRIIAATAFALGAELATADSRLRSLDWVKLA